MLPMRLRVLLPMPMKEGLETTADEIGDVPMKEGMKTAADETGNVPMEGARRLLPMEQGLCR
jgi:hypothetical protein